VNFPGAAVRQRDLVVKGGRVIDPRAGTDEVRDLAIRAGRIATYADSDALVIDATGLLVVPGLVDIHGHVYVGVSPLGIPVDQSCALGGVTTIVSAGDAGANSIDGLRHLIVEQSRTRVLAFLHISSIGLAGWPVAESRDLDYLDVEATVRAGETNRDLLAGIKVRMSRSIVGQNGTLPLERAIAAGERLGLPVMVHVGDTACPLGTLLSLLRPGDIVTHCFAGGINGLVADGHVLSEAWEARQRGVLFDVGHGFASFDFRVAQRAIDEGFFPDTISTDLHRLSTAGTMRDLPTTMSKLLGLGMPFADVLAAVTTRAAAAIRRGDEFGHLGAGAIADVAILELVPGAFQLTDTNENTRCFTHIFVNRHTIREGHLMSATPKTTSMVTIDVER
jgi:dihydroorotase